jgi:O-antigen/teichoic acid export membrane protein
MELNKKIKQQTITSIVYKVVGMIISFLFVPILLEFLGKEDYGIWITISSILLWFSFLDFGMGLGLRNKLTRSLAVNNIKESQSYISSAYFVIFIIFILLMFILIIISTLCMIIINDLKINL